MEKKLSEIANELNNQSGYKDLPNLVFITDQSAQPCPEKIIATLPENSMVILRDYDDENRHNLGVALGYICKSRNIKFLVAGDIELSLMLAADGIHLPEHMIGKAKEIRKAHPDYFITASCHTEDAIKCAVDACVDAIFLAPVFATESHPETFQDPQQTLGVEKVKYFCGKYDMPFYALGGVNKNTAISLRHSGVAGIAAVRGIS